MISESGEGAWKSPRQSSATRIPDISTSDSDFEAEPELPALGSFISKDILRKLKDDDKKWQEVVNELFHTERAHVRNLKVMQQLFYQPMIDDPMIPEDFVKLLFPNIDDMIELHGALNGDFKNRKKESMPIGLVSHVADILVHRFTAAEGEKFMKVCAVFCEDQKRALKVLGDKQHKDQRVAQILQEASLNPLCRRLALKELLPTAWQRLTKYRLLIEKLLSCKGMMTAHPEEKARLEVALAACKNILHHVNQAVQECENRQKLIDLQRRLDTRPLENLTDPVTAQYKNLDFTRHRLLYDGMLTWRLSRVKQIDVYVVLLEDAIVLLQQQDDRLVLRCQTKEDRIIAQCPHSPVIQLATMLTRGVANDKRALYVVSTSDIGPQIYELVTSSKDERNKWLQYITEAADVYKDSNPLKTPPRVPRATRISKPLKTMSNVPEACEVNDTSSAPGADGTTDLESGSAVSVDTQPDDRVQCSMPATSELSQDCLISADVDTHQSTIDKLLETNESMHRLMQEKRRLISDLLQIPHADYENVAEMSLESHDDKDASELVLASLKLSERLVCIVDSHHLQASEDSQPNQQHVSSSLQRSVLMPSLSELITVGCQLQQNLTHLLGLVVHKEDEQHQQHTLQQFAVRQRTGQNSFVDADTNDVISDHQNFALTQSVIDDDSSAETLVMSSHSAYINVSDDDSQHLPADRELLNQSQVLPLTVDLGEEKEEERSDTVGRSSFHDMNVSLSSFRISPINSDDVLKANSHGCTTSTDSEAEPGVRGHTDQHLHTAEDWHPDCDETSGKIAVDVNDIFVNASNGGPLLSSCENPVTNVA